MRKPILSLAVVVVALATTGCGGSSKHTGTTSNVAQASFDVRLGSLCTRANNAFAAAHTDKGRASVVAHYLALFQTLKAPPQLSALYTRYLAVLGKELALIQKGNLNGLFSVAHGQAYPLVRQIGARGCITSS